VHSDITLRKVHAKFEEKKIFNGFLDIGVNRAWCMQNDATNYWNKTI